MPLDLSACTEQLGNSPAERVATEMDVQDPFIVESLEADDEMSQSTVTSSVNVNSAPFTHGHRVEERGGIGEAKRTELQRERRELQPSDKEAAGGVEKMLEPPSPKPSQCLCSIMLTSPRVHIPRKQKPNEGCQAPVDKPDTDQAAAKADKEVGEHTTSGRPTQSRGLLGARCSCRSE